MAEKPRRRDCRHANASKPGTASALKNDPNRHIKRFFVAGIVATLLQLSLFEVGREVLEAKRNLAMLDERVPTGGMSFPGDAEGIGGLSLSKQTTGID